MTEVFEFEEHTVLIGPYTERGQLANEIYEGVRQIERNLPREYTITHFEDRYRLYTLEGYSIGRRTTIDCTNNLYIHHGRVFRASTYLWFKSLEEFDLTCVSIETLRFLHGIFAR